MKKTRIFSLLLTTICIASQAQAPLAEGFDHPQDTARTKVWWFFGETETTREGITADLEAFKEAGVRGVIYYDQVQELAREVCECKEIPNYFTLGPGKVFIGWYRRQKVFEKIRGIRHLVLAEYGLH